MTVVILGKLFYYRFELCDPRHVFRVTCVSFHDMVVSKHTASYSTIVFRVCGTQFRDMGLQFVLILAYLILCVVCYISLSHCVCLSLSIYLSLSLFLSQSLSLSLSLSMCLCIARTSLFSL